MSTLKGAVRWHSMGWESEGRCALWCAQSAWMGICQANSKYVLAFILTLEYIINFSISLRIVRAVQADKNIDRLVESVSDWSVSIASITLSPHNTRSDYTKHHCTSLHLTTLHYTTLHYTTLNHVTLCRQVRNHRIRSWRARGYRILGRWHDT